MPRLNYTTDLREELINIDVRPVRVILYVSCQIDQTEESVGRSAYV